MEARGPQATISRSCPACLVQLTVWVSGGSRSRWAHIQAWMRSALRTSVRAQGRLWLRRPSGTADPHPSLRSWHAAGPCGAPAAPRSGLWSPRGGATVAGAPRCRKAWVPSCRGVLCRWLAPPRPWHPGHPRPAAALWTAARAAPAQAHPGIWWGPACSPRGAGCPSLRSTLWARAPPCPQPAAPPHPRPSWAGATACSGATHSRACSAGRGASASGGTRRMPRGHAHPWIS